MTATYEYLLIWDTTDEGYTETIRAGSSPISHYFSIPETIRTSQKRWGNLVELAWGARGRGFESRRPDF